MEKMLPTRLIVAIRQKSPKPGAIANAAATIWMCLVFLISATHIWMYNSRQTPTPPLNSLVQFISDHWLINNYGPFAVMSTERPEIIVQGSNDGSHWQTYQFKYKPVNLDQKLSWNIPHQPRLDWQMWFAAKETPAVNSWFSKFMLRLKEGSPPVLSLLENNPFPGKPPVYVRALLFRYFYASPEQRKATGSIWEREFIRVYWSSVD
jgi:hypothetical protein